MKTLRKDEKIAVVVGMLVVIIIFVVIPFFSQSIPLPSSLHNAVPATEQASVSNSGLALEGILMQDIVVGSGAEAMTGKKLTVHYTGYLADGTVFDSSDGKDPFVFILGEGEVIEGWEQGIVGMREGGTRLLLIPPELAYGKEGIGVIPPDAALVFEVRLLSAE